MDAGSHERGDKGDEISNSNAGSESIWEKSKRWLDDAMGEIFAVLILGGFGLLLSFIGIGLLGVVPFLSGSEGDEDELPPSPPQISAGFEETRQLLRDDEFEEAIKMANAEMEELGRNHEGLLLRGYAYLQSGSLEEAYDDFDDAAYLDDECFEGLYFRGVVHKRRGEHSKAIRDFTDSLALNGGYVDAFYQRAVAHGRRGMGRDAYDDLLTFVDLAEYDNQFYASAQLLITKLEGVDLDEKRKVKELFEP